MAKQFLGTHDHILAWRPPTAAGKYTNYNYCDLFTPKRLDSYEYIRVEERQEFMPRPYSWSGMPQQYLDLTCASPASPIPIKAQVSLFLHSIITRIVLGKKYFSESEDKGAIVALE
ncbi:hypothetical protein RJ639_032498 [Escallonia herrerae]|uniref:Uncharacterized protein n=1 Tax=Escallonia herrerae TaxID=1293975 RepID=A0AA88WWA7_9ASTE|nr:hypothetical protein RJ639_032498 [Escallonia herrerae]